MRLIKPDRLENRHKILEKTDSVYVLNEFGMCLGGNLWLQEGWVLINKSMLRGNWKKYSKVEWGPDEEGFVKVIINVL